MLLSWHQAKAAAVLTWFGGKRQKNREREKKRERKQKGYHTYKQPGLITWISCNYGVFCSNLMQLINSMSYIYICIYIWCSTKWGNKRLIHFKTRVYKKMTNIKNKLAQYCLKPPGFVRILWSYPWFHPMCIIFHFLFSNLPVSVLFNWLN